ncbi:Rz1-like lysis system protein LysC [Pseudomonas sp. A4]|uniref:Rz1-like lysis system protein LysC n=1 Tax=Pseudomonas sp. S11A4 TaxID=1476791 RepID=UPI00215D465D|nr:Rz1-like lysis system protein LysC [Pseudomonas sp. S11A4]MCR8935679.1 Rz1-like lysis system protein LysC [Pseudomonas sp. S11A4]
MLLAGCASAPPSPVPTLMVSGCPAVVPCTLSRRPARAVTAIQLTDQDRVEGRVGQTVRARWT